MPYKVFISYSTKDFDTVEKVRKNLDLPNVEVFIAEYSIEPGKSLSNEIMKAIKECNLFVLLWSPKSKYSEWVTQEIGIAKAENKKIVPIVLKEGMKLPGFIKDLKYLSLPNSPEKTINWLKEHIFKEAKEKLNKQQSNRVLASISILIVLIWLLSSE